ncbi:NUDIX domain-containing protein [Streptomyces sp. NPDC048737]|uniref:NUDIX domain-containing protein n=1 Tax=unclassified Streptomyces TaxID=2593676 RepID=UPI0034282CAF
MPHTWRWSSFDKLPAPTVAYCRAGLDAYRAGARMGVHFQETGDPIAYDPAVDRLLLVPGHGRHGAVPEDAAHAFAERAVGRITRWTDVSWAREESRVWRAHGVEGGTWYVKVHQNDRFHQREVAALRGWVAGLGEAAPRLLATVYGLPGTQWPHSTVGMVFDGGRLTAAQIRGITLDPQEHDEVRVLPLAEWKALMPARDFARLSAVEEARRTGEAAYFGTWDWGNE